jgi:hypothetical protein
MGSSFWNQTTIELLVKEPINYLSEGVDFSLATSSKIKIVKKY